MLNSSLQEQKAKSKTTDHWLSPRLKPYSSFVCLPALHKGELLFRGSKILNRKPSFLLTLTREMAPLYQERKNGNAAVVQKEKVRIKSLTQPMAFDG